MDALTLFNEPAAIIRLIKLHGSVNWLIDSEGTVSEESVLGQSFFGRKIVGEMMIYPVQQKDLYLEPYISMYKLLNNKLSEKLIWIIIGYSFNDPIIREIFVRNSRADKIMVFVHPDALRIAVERLKGLKNDVRLLNEWFGQDGHYRKVNYDIISKLISNPRFDAEETPVSQK